MSCGFCFIDSFVSDRVKAVYAFNYLLTSVKPFAVFLKYLIVLLFL